MRKRYIVHGANYTQHIVKATVNGAEQEVLANALHVELIPEDGVGGAIQLPIINPSQEESDLFSEQGRVIEITFT